MNLIKQHNLKMPVYGSLLAILMTSMMSIASAQTKPNALEKTTRIGQLEWDLHEVTIGSVKLYAQQTKFVSSGEKEG
ncbi:MAG: hypothetical protein RL615_299, partial [Pseudomonadota bacterium]